MKRILYLTTWDFIDENSDGVCKKIKNQIRILRDNAFVVDVIFIRGNDVVFSRDGQEKIIARIGNIKKTPAYIKIYRVISNLSYDYVYNRFGLFDTAYVDVLKKLKKNGAKILVEIPTYPYSGEMEKGLLNYVLFSWDKMYHHVAYKFVDRVVTYSRDETIWDLKTIQIKNGIAYHDLPIAEYSPINDIHFIAVANVMPAHGYDRVIEGLRDYYANACNHRTVFFHVVGGGGEAMSSLKKAVDDYSLGEYVIFHGRKSGKDLDEIYDICHLGIESLADFRVGISVSSSLKSREYTAKGLPFVTACESDAFENQWYVYKVKASENLVNINELVEFTETIYREHGENIRYAIHNEAKSLADISVTMRPVIDYLNN